MTRENPRGTAALEAAEVCRGWLQDQRAVVVTGATVVGLAAATALAAQVRIPLPFSPVPLTLQTFVVLLSGVSLGFRVAVAGQALYVALGALGLPVFSGGVSGLGGPTTGFLVAFPLAAAVAALLAQRHSRVAAALGLLAGTVVIYLLGSAWLVATGLSWGRAVMLGVVPFLPGDGLKLLAAWAASGMVRRAYRCAAGQSREGGQ